MSLVIALFFDLCVAVLEGEIMKQIVQIGKVKLKRFTRYFLNAALLLGVFSVLGGGLLFETGTARAQTSDLSGLASSGYGVSVSPDTTNVSSTTIQHGNRSWMAIINNNMQSDATNAAISFNSGYNPTLFDAVSAFPVSTNFGTLPAGGLQIAKLFPSGDSMPVDYMLGYDSTKTTNVASIPAGGGQQTVTITVTPKDSRYVPSTNSDISFHLFVFADSSIPGVTVASTTDPNNLDQGEQVLTTVDPGQAHWQLGSPQINKTYTFTATLNVPNDTGAPFDFQPIVQLDGQRHTDVVNDQVGPSVTAPEPTLDGSTPGMGAMTFSADGSNHIWSARHADIYGVVYDGTQREEPQPLEVPILIKPGSPQPPAINPKSKAIIPVAVLSTPTFDATTINTSTITFGPMGPTRANPLWWLRLDVNRDKRPDMLFFFRTQDAGFGCEAPNAGIQGQTTSGQQIYGNSPIRIVGHCKK